MSKIVEEKTWLCPAPFEGLTISPTGHITLCCVTPHEQFLGHISQYSSLEKAYNSEPMNLVRQMFTDKKGRNIPQCKVCWDKIDSGEQSYFDELKVKDGNKTRPHFDEDFEKEYKTIRFLEFSTSNICNATCSMCNGMFSSKWLPYEEQAPSWRKGTTHGTDAELYRMTDNDIRKILEVLPTLDELVIKGGEPFADYNNLKILERLNECNSTAKLSITTNFHIIPPKFMDAIIERKKVHNTVFQFIGSIDATGDLYEWIRSTYFLRTVDTMKRLYENTGLKYIISPTISLYNFFNLADIVEYFHDKEYVGRIAMKKIVSTPKYCSPMMLPKQIINDTITEFQTKISDKNKNISFLNVDDNSLIGDNYFGTEIYDENKDRIWEWIDYIDSMRYNDLKLLEIVPRFKTLKDELEQYK